MTQIKVPTRSLPADISGMPTSNPGEAAAKQAAIEAFWDKTMFIVFDVPVEIEHKGAEALNAFQRDCEAKALQPSSTQPSES